MTEDRRQKDGWYEKGHSLTERWLGNGYIPNWFRWVEWVTLTCVLVTAAIKATNGIGQVILGVVAAVSILFVYYSGMIGFNVLTSGLLEKYKLKNKLGFWSVISLVFLIPSALLFGLTTAILSLIPQ
ncbi:hypothetical protein [Microbulbifer sp. PSTR4-B]|uniref:hypothetical protein n=1 Tax=unclassified Microbulbifer TaxID=2619833 RepID=UPI00403AC56B